MKELSQCREEIDQVDRQLLALFTQRMDICQEVVRYKAQAGLPIFDSSREQAVLDGLAARTTPELLPYAQELWRTLMSLSKTYQQAVLEQERKP